MIIGNDSTIAEQSDFDMSDERCYSSRSLQGPSVMPRKCCLCRGVVSHQGDETMYFDYFVHDNSSLNIGGIKSHMINFVHISLFCHIFI